MFINPSDNDKTDLDVIRENHRFLWEDADEAESSWAKKLAKKYWDKLFKEYCITDLGRYKENKVQTSTISTIAVMCHLHVTSFV